MYIGMTRPYRNVTTVNQLHLWQGGVSHDAFPSGTISKAHKLALSPVLPRKVGMS